MANAKDAIRQAALELLATDPERWPISVFDIVIYESREAVVAALTHVLEQVAGGLGFDPSTPISGVGTEGFYLFLGVLGLTTKNQSASFLKDSILDSMSLASPEGSGWELTMYNLVSRRRN